MAESDSQWVGLRSLDRDCGWPKGAAFRAFKAQRERRVEGRDYRVLDHARDAAEIAALKQSGQVYANSVNAVVLSPEFAASLRRGGMAQAPA